MNGSTDVSQPKDSTADERAADERKLTNLTDQVSKTKSGNIAAYDKAILTLSSAALALSLTFSKDLVPMKTALSSWLLFASWGGFIVTIAINIVGFILSIHSSEKTLKDIRRCYREKKLTEEQLQELADGRSMTLHRLNVAQGITFLVAMVLFGSYVAINEYREVYGMNKDLPFDPPPPVVKKSDNTSFIVPIAPRPSSPAPTPAQPAAPPLPAATKQD